MIRRLILYLCLFITTPAFSKTVPLPYCDSCIDFNLLDINEYWGNEMGGEKKRGSYLGFTEASVDIHLDKIFNGHYGSFHISGENNRGNPMSNKNLGTLDFISNIENYNQAKLYEFYYENNFGPWYFKFGKFDFARDFEIDNISSDFLNASMVSSMVINNNTFNMSNYGPASSPGAEVRFTTDEWDIGLGISSDNPYRGNFNKDFTDMNTDPTGTAIFWKTSMIYLEVKKNIKIMGLLGTYTVGGFIDTGKQANTYDDRFHTGNELFYATVNQTVWENNIKSLSVFVRLAVDPRKDRTAIDYTIDTGILYQEGDDFAGLGFSLTKPNSRMLLPESEMRLEATYSHSFNKYIAVQPNIQYIIHPGGMKEENELVTGVRTTFVF